MRFILEICFAKYFDIPKFIHIAMILNGLEANANLNSILFSRSLSSAGDGGWSGEEKQKYKEKKIAHSSTPHPQSSVNSMESKASLSLNGEVNL